MAGADDAFDRDCSINAVSIAATAREPVADGNQQSNIDAVRPAHSVSDEMNKLIGINDSNGPIDSSNFRSNRHISGSLVVDNMLLTKRIKEEDELKQEELKAVDDEMSGDSSM